MNNDPLAYFITWTVYGTYLQGDERGWKKRRTGEQLPQPRLAEWRRQRLKHPILLLNAEQRAAVTSVIRAHCHLRRWDLLAIACRSNHAHAIVFARDHAGNEVRDQLKANSTRVLRASWPEFADRPVWSTGGDWQCINAEDELQAAIVYVTEAQDRMHLPK